MQWDVESSPLLTSDPDKDVCEKSDLEKDSWEPHDDSDTGDEGTSSRSDSPYHSDGEVIRRCETDSDSFNNSDASDIAEEDVSGYLSSREKEDIFRKKDEMSPSDQLIYPEQCRLRLEMVHPEILKRISSVTQTGWAFAAHCIPQLIRKKYVKKPGCVQFDVCCICPTKPLMIQTYATDTDKCAKYNAWLTRMIISRIEDDTKLQLGAVYGVIDEKTYLCDDEFGKKIEDQKISANMEFFQSSLCMDETRYSIVTGSLLKLFSLLETEHSRSIPNDVKHDMRSTEDTLVRQLRKQLQESEEKIQRLQQDKEEMKDTVDMYWGPTGEQLWTNKDMDKLMKIINKSRRNNDGTVMDLRILVFGPICTGKSSLCNGFRSAILGEQHPSTYHAVAARTKSFTKQFEAALYGNNWIIDMPGVYDPERVTKLNIENIVSGKVPFCGELTESFHIVDIESKRRVQKPNDVSCVIIVLKFDMEPSEQLTSQLGVIIELAGKGVTSYHVVLTHLDICDPQFKITENLQCVFKSQRAQKAVAKWSRALGIPSNAISFVKNYVEEKDTNMITSVQHLRVLEVVFASAEGQEKKRLQERKNQDQGSTHIHKWGVHLMKVLFIGLLFAVLIKCWPLFEEFFHFTPGVW